MVELLSRSEIWPQAGQTLSSRSNHEQLCYQWDLKTRIPNLIRCLFFIVHLFELKNCISLKKHAHLQFSSQLIPYERLRVKFFFRKLIFFQEYVLYNLKTSIWYCFHPFFLQSVKCRCLADTFDYEMKYVWSGLSIKATAH